MVRKGIIMKKLVSLLLALMLAMSLVACGANNSNENGTNSSESGNQADVYQIGDYEIEYREAKIAPDDDGVPSVIVTLGFTNNSKSAATYGFSVSEKAEQAGEFMYIAALNSIADEYYYKEIQPGETSDVIIGFNLNAVDYQGNLNYDDEVKITLQDVYGDDSVTLTVLPSETPVEDGVAVGDTTENNGDTASASNGTQGHGDFAAIWIPEEFELLPDSWNEENPHFVSVKKSDFTYFDFRNYEDGEQMKKDYESVKKTYTHEQTDVTATYNGITWEGFQYGDGFGGYAFEVYTVLGSNNLRVSSAGMAFDHETVVSVLSSVVMADGSGATSSEENQTTTETTPGDLYGLSADWLDYWDGDWYGWWLLTDGTGTYANIGQGIWDACAHISANEETMNGYMEIWDSDGNAYDIISYVELGFANPDDTKFGVMSCEGGYFFAQVLESGDWVVNPDTLAYENIFDFRGTCEDEYGTFSYRVLLRPWGTVWDDLGEEYYPETYYDWYLPLIEAGESMPESIG